MIITKQKSLEDILALVGKRPVFILGCSECATVCQTGGESQVLEMKGVFEQHNIPVTGWTILDPACHKLNSKRLLKAHKEALAQTKSLVVLACGNGIQTVAELFEQLDVIPGTDTLFLGEIKHIDEFEKRCSMCGECLIDIFGGICPITRCPKAMLNGPCGGVNNGKCEIDENLDCIWVHSIKILQQKEKQQVLKIIQPPKDWSKARETKRCI
jgi:ferredoxin